MHVTDVVYTLFKYWVILINYTYYMVKISITWLK